MTKEYCEGKQAHVFDVAKKIADTMTKRDRRAKPYKCAKCGQWHVASVLTGQLKRVKQLKYR